MRAAHNKLRYWIPIIVLLLTTLAQAPHVYAQPPEPPLDPEEEWYPPIPTKEVPAPYMCTVVGSTPTHPGRLVAWFENERYVKTYAFYKHNQIFLVISSPTSDFFLFIYEYYPPGTVPKGHWLTWNWRIRAGGVIRIGPFLPEPLEPEGVHTWKIWLWDVINSRWYVTIIRFDYRERPPTEGTIMDIYVPSTMKPGESYQITVEVKNTGIAGSTFRVQVTADGATVSPSHQLIDLGPGELREVSFSIIPNVPGTMTVRISLISEAERKTLDERTRIVQVIVSLPSIRTDIKIPTLVAVGRSALIDVSIVNEGEGTARNIVISVTNTEDCEVRPKTISIGSLIPGQSTEASLTIIPLAEEGSISIEINYQDEVGKSHRISRTISISAVLPRAEIVGLRIPEEIMESEEKDIEIIILNPSKVETDVKLMLKPGPGLTVFPSERSLTLEPGEETAVMFSISGEAGDRKLRITLIAGERIMEDKFVRIKISPKPMIMSPIIAVAIAGAACIAIIIIAGLRMRRKKFKKPTVIKSNS